jgi:hypothetical protein
MNTALKLAPPLAPDLQESAAQARAELARLKRAAELAAESFEAADAAFEMEPEPTKESFIERGLAEQRAKAAKRAYELHVSETAALLAEASREGMTSELDAIRESLATRSKPFDAQRTRLTDVVAAFRRDVRGALLDLYSALTAHNVKHRRAQVLADALGTGENFRGENIDEILSSIAKSICPEPPGYGADQVAIRVNNSTGDARNERYTVELTGRCAS